MSPTLRFIGIGSLSWANAQSHSCQKRRCKTIRKSRTAHSHDSDTIQSVESGDRPDDRFDSNKRLCVLPWLHACKTETKMLRYIAGFQRFSMKCRRVEEGRWTGDLSQPVVSLPRSSNRTCPFRASGFPTDFTISL